MTGTIIELSEDAFDTNYPLLTNHLNPTASWAYGEGIGCLFETYGEELAFVRRQDPRTVWTFIDGDDGDQYVLSGFHLPAAPDDTGQVSLPSVAGPGGTRLPAGVFSSPPSRVTRPPARRVGRRVAPVP